MLYSSTVSCFALYILLVFKGLVGQLLTAISPPASVDVFVPLTFSLALKDNRAAYPNRCEYHR